MAITCAAAVSAELGCKRPEAEREAEERAYRVERLQRMRARQARLRSEEAWYDRHRRLIAESARQRPAAPRAPAKSPMERLEDQVGSAGFLDGFARAVEAVAEPIGADLVSGPAGPLQRFTFAVRMHPAEEPSLGNPRAKPALELRLRRSSLCPGAPDQEGEATLRIRLVPAQGPSSRFPVLRPQRSGAGAKSIPVGVPVALLLDPAQSTLSPSHVRGAGSPREAATPKGRGSARPATMPGGQAGTQDVMGTVRSQSAGASPTGRADPRSAGGSGPAPPSCTLGIWRITGARHQGRGRRLRLRMETGALGDRLGRIHLVEVDCPAPGGRCRFLTRQVLHRDETLSLQSLFRWAAPVSRVAQARQLHRIVRALRYPRCTSGARKPASSAGHPCLNSGPHQGTLECQYFRAHQSLPTPVTVTRGEDSLATAQVLRCESEQLRVIRLTLRISRSGDMSLSEEDLSARGPALEAALRKLVLP